MPKYDYKCTVCNHIFEIYQSFSSEPISNCPECSNLAKRQFQVVPIVFKGSGFYVNDYGKKGSTSTSTNSDSTNNNSDTKKSNIENKNQKPVKSNTKNKKEKSVSNSKQNISSSSNTKSN